MRYTTYIDVVSDTKISEVLKMFEKHSAKIEDFKSDGPAGGNPIFYLSFETEENALSLLKDFHDDDDLNFLRELITVE